MTKAFVAKDQKSSSLRRRPIERTNNETVETASVEFRQKTSFSDILPKGVARKTRGCMRSARQKLSKISSVVESTQRLRINQHLDKTFWSTRFYAGNSRAKEIIVTENLLFDHGAMGCWN